MKSNEVAEAVRKFKTARAGVESCQQSIRQLQIKCDDLQESLPALSRAVEDAEKQKTAALDNFALLGSKESESELKRVRVAYDQATKQQIETNELVEATFRAVKKQEFELVKLNAACEAAKKECWKAIFGEIKTKISGDIIGDVQTLYVCGGQYGQTRQFILDSLFPNLSTGEFQEIKNRIAREYEILD